MDVRVPRIILAFVIVLSGCSGLPLGGDSETNLTTTTSDTQDRVQPDQAIEIAMKAEKNRVSSKLDSKSNFSDATVGVYADPQANVLNKTGEGVIVQINMSYSYSYHCGQNSGSVDGERTQTIYLVINESAELKRTVKKIKNAC